MSDPVDDRKGGGPPPNLPRPGQGPPKSGGPPGPPPSPALQRQAPGVRGSRQAPETIALKTGDSVGGRFFIERYLGSSGGATSYLSNDAKTQTPVVVKVLEMAYPGDEEFQRIRRQIGAASSVDHPNLTSAVGMGRTESGDIFIAMEFVEGATLSQLISERREQGRTLSLRDVFTVLAHTCDALEAVHQRRLCHAVLTPYNIYVTDEGRVRVGNLGFGRVVGTYLQRQGQGAFVDSIYVAPEVAADPQKVSRQADLYSLGMIAAELLSPTGLPGDRKEAHEVAVDVLANYPPSLFSLISGCLTKDPRKRPDSVTEFRAEFEEIARDAGAKLEGPPPAGALPILPAVEVDVEAGEDDLFDLFDPDEIGGPAGAGTNDDRYLVQKERLDYGPFTEEEILEQLYADEINEHSSVLDRVTQDRRPLQEHEVFRERVLAYIPKREERLRLEAERREAIKETAKKGGKAVLVLGIVAGLVVLAGMIWVWMHLPDPEPIPLEKAFASMDYHFSPPPTEFQTMEVDPDVLQSIFNPEATEAEIARQIAQAQRAAAPARRAGSGSSARAGSAGSGSGRPRETTVDMGADGGTDHHLTNQEINQVITADFAALRNCVMQEIRGNPSFRGVTIQFFIRPSGTTGGVELKESQYQNRPVGQCLIERFRAMRFPEHGALHERGVEYPLYVQ